MKQQEYQEALDTLRRICLSIPALAQGDEMGFSEDFDFNHDGYEDECDTLQQLIDKLPYWLELEEKDKPMKPIEYDGQIPWVSYNCPNCLWTISSVMKESYCETCGQKIDWSDEE